MLITVLGGELGEWLLDLYDIFLTVVDWGVSGCPQKIPLLKNISFYFFGFKGKHQFYQSNI